MMMMKEVCILEVYRFFKRMKEDDGEMAEEEEDGGM